MEFTVHALPVAQPRQRHRVMQVHGKQLATNYTPTKHPVNAFKAAVQMAFAEVNDEPPLTGPVIMSLAFVMPRPQSMLWKKRPMPREADTRKPDIENLAKAVMDALTGLAYHDDRQIAGLVVAKLIAAGDEQPHVEVAIGNFTGKSCLR